LFCISYIIHILTINGSNMSVMLQHETVLRFIMIAVTVTMSRSLMFLLVKFQ
jgi:hypothetical protein